jgi:hypothetical protein
MRPKATPDAVAAATLGSSSLIKRGIIGEIICGPIFKAHMAISNRSISLDMAKCHRLPNEAPCPGIGLANLSLTKKSTMRPPEKRRALVIKKVAL